MIHDAKQKYFTPNAFQTFESFLWRLITDIRARFTFCEGFRSLRRDGTAGKQIAKAKAKVSLSDDLWLRELLKSYCLPLTSSLHTSLFISSLCRSPICWGGFLSLPLDICLFDYCAQLNIKRDLFLSLPFHFLCLFNKNVIYHVRWMERDAGRLRQRETSKIIRAHYRQALAPPPLMPSRA